jgi:hypothetical protein
VEGRADHSAQQHTEDGPRENQPAIEPALLGRGVPGVVWCGVVGWWSLTRLAQLCQLLTRQPPNKAHIHRRDDSAFLRFVVLFWPSFDHAPVYEHQRPHQLPPHGQALQHPEEGQEDGGGLPDLGVRREAALKKKVGGWMCMYV